MIVAASEYLSHKKMLKIKYTLKHVWYLYVYCDNFHNLW